MGTFRNFLYDFNLFSNSAGSHLFNIHFSPIFAVLSPVYLLGPATMIFIWKFLCYGILLCTLRQIIKTQICLPSHYQQLFLLVVSFHPTFISNLIEPNIWDADLNLPFLSLAIFYMLHKKYSRSMLWFACTFLVKEDMLLVGTFWGIFLVFLTKKFSYLWFTLLSLIGFVTVTQFIMPLFSDAEYLHLMHQNYGHLGHSFKEVFINIAKNPLILIGSGFWMRKIISLLIIFGCTGFLPFFKKTSLVYLIPGIVILGYTAISNEPFLDYSKHYILSFFVFVIVSSFQSYLQISNRFRKIIIMFSLMLSLFVLLVLQIYTRSWSYYLLPIENYDALYSASKMIPSDKLMLTHGVASPWTCYKKNADLSSNFHEDRIEQKKYDYILINKKTIFWEVINEEDQAIKENLKRLNLNNNYKVIFHENDVVLLKRSIKKDLDSSQMGWSENLENFEKINQILMKPRLIRKFYRR